MKGKMTEEMVVENLLSEWPIKERQDQRQLNALVATLLIGEKRPVEFEKTIVPVDVVGRYIVVEHTFPLPSIPSARHYAKEIGTYDEYPEALKEFYIKADKAIGDADSEEEIKEILLVGEFKNQKLDFDSKWEPDVNTGFVLGRTLTKDVPELWKSYVMKEPGDPTTPVTLNTKLYVELDRQAAKLKFEQSVLKGNQLNVEFWKVDPEKNISRKQQKNGGDEDSLLHKRKKRQDMTTEQWVVDPTLLSKKGSKGQGKGIT